LPILKKKVVKISNSYLLFTIRYWIPLELLRLQMLQEDCPLIVCKGPKTIL
jgi:hypothetical protein